MAEKKRQYVVRISDDRGGHFIQVWSDLTREQLASIEGVEHTMAADTYIGVNVDPRYDTEDVYNEIVALAEAAAKEGVDTDPEKRM